MDKDLKKLLKKAFAEGSMYEATYSETYNFSNFIEENAEALQKLNTESKQVVKSSQELPDARLHQAISFVKSTIRIGACILGFYYHYTAAFALLGFAEVVGIIEELV